MTSTTRSETALIRPYAQIDDADSPLESVRLLVGEVSYEPGAVVLPDDQLGAELRLVLPPPQVLKEAVARTIVPAVDCGLVVVASARSHRISAVLLNEYLKPEAWTEELVLNRSSADMVLNDKGGFSLTVAVVLLHDLEPAPLRPHMAGTWLARRGFNVAPERDETSFAPEELTDEIREFHQLPKDALRYIDVGDWQAAEVLSDQVHVYLDAQVLNLLYANPDETTGIQMQIELAVQSWETVAATIARELASDGAQPSANSLDAYTAARSFFENLASNLELTVADVLSFALSEPARLRAHLEAAFGMRAATTAALKEK